MGQITQFMAKLTPFGVFAVVASAAGTRSACGDISRHDAGVARTAEAHLGLPPSTLRSRMQKLGITCHRRRAGDPARPEAPAMRHFLTNGVAMAWAQPTG